ncbi:universal stress protein [Paenarthrobacter sp. S56]|uniref:universal stress protein n=1 Tax=Paenarthrobacter sp. S56 TaxID=3138179 RepID=UPI00321A6D5B
MDSSGRIVVGYDGSREAALAVRWAARHAKARGCGLHLVHCSTWQMVSVEAGSGPDAADGRSRHVAETIIEEGIADVVEVAPGTELSTSLVYGWPAENLRKLSSQAELLVVGSRGMGGFMGLLVGSVSLDLASTANCPVAVIRRPERSGGPVVAGIGDEGWEFVLGQASLFALLAGTPPADRPRCWACLQPLLQRCSLGAGAPRFRGQKRG